MRYITLIFLLLMVVSAAYAGNSKKQEQQVETELKQIRGKLPDEADFNKYFRDLDIMSKQISAVCRTTPNAPKNRGFELVCYKDGTVRYATPNTIIVTDGKFSMAKETKGELIAYATKTDEGLFVRLNSGDNMVSLGSINGRKSWEYDTTLSRVVLKGEERSTDDIQSVMTQYAGCRKKLRSQGIIDFALALLNRNQSSTIVELADQYPRTGSDMLTTTPSLLVGKSPQAFDKCFSKEVSNAN